MTSNRARAAFRLLLGLGLCARAGAAGAQQAQTFPVSVLVFYDENGNGVLDAGEDVRLPNVAVSGPGAVARTSAEGAATLSLPAGDQRVGILAASLPAYYVAPSAATLSVPN